MSERFCTVGHSNRSLDAFIAILHAAGVTSVADVRSFPRSRSNPAYNIDTLPETLQHRQIGYRHFPDLGGRRPKQAQVDADINAFWDNRSFHNYADYALSPAFVSAYQALVAAGRARCIALMCSEAVWWRCHRRIITDYLLLDGFDVTHLMGDGREDPAKPTVAARRSGDGKVIYPAPAATDQRAASH
ncbi:DUF488 domain-containing protein [Aquicoccus sp. G2-2]|uniref:DUF488 domain-containing protein n=1 Tax=Aquicoccus sp. G2-2 TaxID=3092120 RepID=UPI002ADF631C|nr:DUF488 domain-containing protein [Aquicoccus sp. G2-2]MEA1113662.1 DUF488 domain-containing protein [Aquicoccus sp. G2-2]